MLIIGLIDDEEEQLKQIRRTIKTNAPKNNKIEYDFKSYKIADKADELVEKVLNEVMLDIVEERVSLLVIDYKIMIQVTKIEGTDILKELQTYVPKFPVIILTDVIGECIEHNFVDPDKVYKKSDFFKIESDYSQLKTFNIFQNMINYNEIRSGLEKQLRDLSNNYICNKENGSIINQILQVEKTLDDYRPIRQTYIDKTVNTDDFKEIIDLMEKANKLME